MTAAAAGLLLEREAELALGRHVLERAGSTGDGVLVSVEGPSGIGKTRLPVELGAEARSLGFAVFEARGGELEQDLAFGVVRQLFELALTRADAADRDRALEGAAALAGPVLGIARPGSKMSTAHAAGSADPFFAALHGLYWLVANLAAQGPMLLSIDDAQWGDGPSLRFVDYFARRLDGLPVVLAFAVRWG
jgi:predicted ATPase